jgi:RNA polymerase primary sigma factor
MNKNSNKNSKKISWFTNFNIGKEKERKIVEMRNGLGIYNGVMHTLEEVGEEFQVTRERIRQIEAKVHEKIRDHEKAYRLKNF